jgi:cytochrome c biogenesis protein CcdA/thiol-disulfide isomerase/thioredoxin
MTLIILSYLGGVLTILSPCILPVLPFVFARADRPFLKSGLPLLIGMVATFAVVATLAAVGGGWAVQANLIGRDIALVVLALFGVTLLFPHIAEVLTRPLVGLGNKLSENAQGKDDIGGSLLLGVATGLLWSPCAGPILGLIFAGAALHGANAGTTFLLIAYALGSATALSAALFLGKGVFAAMKKSLGAGEWVRRGLGALVLIGVVAIAFGLDTKVLSQLSFVNTTRFEQSLLDGGGMSRAHADTQTVDGPLPVMGEMPPLDGATTWLNSPPLTAEQLRGKVVLVDFWTYSCINCLRSLPYVRAWAEKYRDQGLVVIGVHAPEFAFERDLNNVRNAVRDLHVAYPVVVDNDRAIWRAFDNHYWPAHYFIDAQGRIRHEHFGEGEYAYGEHVIQALLREAGQTNVPTSIVNPNATGEQAAADVNTIGSPETYIGYAKARNFVSPQTAHDQAAMFTIPSGMLDANQWGLTGSWTRGSDSATLGAAGGTIRFRFHARDLHLVLGPAANGHPVRYRVSIDGHAPGAAHGVDTDANGMGVVRENRLYQLIRQQGAIGDRTFEIEFLDPDVQAFSFTFG